MAQMNARVRNKIAEARNSYRFRAVFHLGDKQTIGTDLASQERSITDC
jgi:hypothetical protein